MADLFCMCTSLSDVMGRCSACLERPSDTYAAKTPAQWKANFDLALMRRRVETVERELAALGPLTAGFLVAPDVWDQLAASVPVVRGSSLSIDGVYVKKMPELSPGTWFPVDRNGTPIPKPKKEGAQ